MPGTGFSLYTMAPLPRCCTRQIVNVSSSLSLAVLAAMKWRGWQYMLCQNIFQSTPCQVHQSYYAIQYSCCKAKQDKSRKPWIQHFNYILPDQGQIRCSRKCRIRRSPQIFIWPANEFDLSCTIAKGISTSFLDNDEMKHKQRWQLMTTPADQHTEVWLNNDIINKFCHKLEICLQMHGWSLICGKPHQEYH